MAFLTLYRHTVMFLTCFICTGDDDGINEPLLGDTDSAGPLDQEHAHTAPSLVDFFLLGWEAMVYYVNWFMNMSFGAYHVALLSLRLVCIISCYRVIRVCRHPHS